MPASYLKKGGFSTEAPLKPPPGWSPIFHFSWGTTKRWGRFYERFLSRLNPPEKFPSVLHARDQDDSQTRLLSQKQGSTPPCTTPASKKKRVLHPVANCGKNPPLLLMGGDSYNLFAPNLLKHTTPGVNRPQRNVKTQNVSNPVSQQVKILKRPPCWKQDGQRRKLKSPTEWEVNHDRPQKPRMGNGLSLLMDNHQ